MSVVTTTSIKKLMMDNIIQYIGINVTDPASGTRPTDSPFVFPKFSKVELFLPQIYVEITGGSATGTGIRNQMETHSFLITAHVNDYDVVYSLGDELYNELKKDVGDYFFDARMYRPETFLSPYRVIPHENNDGTLYITFEISFDFFHN